MTMPTSETQGLGPGNDVFAHEEETWRVLELVRERVQALNAARFSGEDPVVRPKGRGGPIEVAVATLAAERSRGLLELKGSVISPTEDLAIAALDAGLRALTTWDVTEANWYLATAVQYARLPETQQRVGLAQELSLFLASLLDTDPEKLSSRPPVERRVLALLDTLDRLPEEERLFYRVEVQRLVDLWWSIRAGSSQDSADREAAIAWTAWQFLQARLAIRNGARLDALVTLLRIAQRHLHIIGTSEYVVDLINRVRQFIQLLLFPFFPEAQPQSGHSEEGAVYPGELQEALLTLLSQYYERDLTMQINRFSLALYQRSDLGRWRQGETR
ncbi:hypothetical protein [Thermorudis peleae]|uniref:hypothetical protein n=1 Tax=Thermorudis peleae TaxID=1382356 RepID=UPI000571FDDE|nr:hypothetical protein [Thermorudis peleae]MBX6753076.1 hypothetical protein [Thermorudis peleae]